MLSAGQAHDLTCAEPLIEAVDPGAVIADKAYDADAFVDDLNARAITPVIPSKSNRKTPRPCDFALYCERNLIERFFNTLKHFRAIATRYDKLAKIFLAGVHLRRLHTGRTKLVIATPGLWATGGKFHAVDSGRPGLDRSAAPATASQHGQDRRGGAVARAARLQALLALTIPSVSCLL